MIYNICENGILYVGLFPDAVEILHKALIAFEGKTEAENILAITMSSLLEVAKGVMSNE